MKNYVCYGLWVLLMVVGGGKRMGADDLLFD